MVVVSKPAIHNLEDSWSTVCDSWPVGQSEDVVLSACRDPNAFQQGFSSVEAQNVVGKPIPLIMAAGKEPKRPVRLHNKTKGLIDYP